MNTSLKTLMGGFFGKYDKLVLTMSGLGFKAKDGEVSVYDKASKTITKVPGDFVLGDIPVYVIPAQDTTLKEGDLVVHNDYLKVYLGKNEDGTHKAINVKTQEVQTLVPTKNLFGFGVFSKVVSLFDGIIGGAPTAGGLMDQNALLMFALMGDKDKDGGLDDMLPLLALSGGFGGTGAGAMNPMMMALLMKGKF